MSGVIVGVQPAAEATESVPGKGSRADIEFRHVVKRYPGQHAPALDDLSFTVPAGKICCLVGPSGGGKTTTMMLVNRLIELTDGDILIGGHSVRSIDITTLRRNIGYVIQEVGLFPHMTIAGNIAVVPKLLGWSKSRIKQRVRDLLDLVQLDRSYARRYPAQLSGGQRQRIGLARALAVDPPVMLMDEPFGALDPITRAGLQDEFLRLQREIRKTVIFVTHDIDEAVKMGDRVAVLRQGGTLAQYGTADELLGHPADDYVADFVGAERGLKRLALTKMREIVRPESLSRKRIRDGDTRQDRSDLPTVRADASLRVGLSTLFIASATEVEVVDDDGRALGVVTLEELHAAAGAGDVERAAADVERAAADVDRAAAGDR